MNAVAEGGTAARGAAALVGLQAVTRAGALLFVLVATRQVDPAVYGRYSVVAAVVLVGGFLADFGTTSAITRLVSVEPGAGDRLLTGTLLVSLAIGGATYLGAVGFAVVAGYPGVQVVDVAIGAVALPLSAMAGSVLGVLDGVGRIATRGALNAAQSAVITIGGCLTVVVTGDVRLAVLALGIAPAVALAGGVLVVRRAGLWSGRLVLDVEATGRVLRLALPIAVSGGITALAMRLDVLLLSILSTGAETAAYDLAVRAVEASAFVALAVGASLLPTLTAREAGGDRAGVQRAYAVGVRWVYLLGVPISVVLAVLGAPLATLAFGDGYAAAGVPLAIVGGAYVVQFLATVQGVLGQATDWLVPSVRRAGVALAVMVALDLVLIPRWGSDGAAWATLAATLLLAGSLTRMFAAGGVRTPPPPVRVVVAGAAMAVTALALRPEPVLAAVLAALAYAAVLAATGELRGDRAARPGGARPAPRRLHPRGEPPVSGPVVDVVILTWNDGPLLEAAIDSVVRSTGVDARIVVVDNGSSPPASSASHAPLRWLRNAENRGVARARNQGVAVGTAPYVCLLDSDARVTPTALARLVTMLEEHADVGLVAPTFADQVPSASAGPAPTLRTKLQRMLNVQDVYEAGNGFQDGQRDVDFAIGACQLFRRRAFEGVGGLDESYFYGPEDVDFCLRLREAGWRIVQLEDAVVHHPPRRRFRGIATRKGARHAQAVLRHLWRHRDFHRRVAA